MKKQKKSKKIISIRLSIRKHEKNIKRKNIYYSTEKPREQSSLFGNRKFIVAPSVISLYELSDNRQKEFNETVDFINNIERDLARNDCVFDFRNTEHASAAALIAIFATIEEAIEASGKTKSVILWSTKSPAVNKAIKRTKISNLIKGTPYNKNLANHEHLPIVSSYGSEKMEEIIDHIVKSVYKDNMTPEEEYKFGDAVSETINNVGLHAYPKKDAQYKRWWLLCNVIGDQLYLAIYDKGVGIPKTVLDKPWFFATLESAYPEQYQELTQEFPEFERTGLIPIVKKKLYDAELIGISMAGDVSGTKKSKHGQGSKSIRALVDECEDGKLWVFSNKGLYHFCSVKDGPSLYKLPQKLPGTLVQWNIKLT